MFQGLRTNIFRVRSADLEKAKIWYSKLFGKGPYFDQPFYVGFNVGGFELQTVAQRFVIQVSAFAVNRCNKTI